jgi:hypothetical protein
MKAEEKRSHHRDHREHGGEQRKDRKRGEYLRI